MKLIHCADLHLDSSMTTHLTKEKAKERKLEREALAKAEKQKMEKEQEAIFDAVLQEIFP